MDKKDLINAIAGIGFPTMQTAIEMTNIGLARFTGNQWNENWDWDRQALEKLDEQELRKMYQLLKDVQ